MKSPELAVGALIINEKNEILLLQTKKWGKKYTLPGGHVKQNEKVKDAIPREVKEETGLDVQVIEFFGIRESINDKDYAKKEHCIILEFVCKTLSKNVKIDKKEVKAFKWVPLKKAPDMDLNSTAGKAINAYIAKKGL